MMQLALTRSMLLQMEHSQTERRGATEDKSLCIMMSATVQHKMNHWVCNAPHGRRNSIKGLCKKVQIIRNNVIGPAGFTTITVRGQSVSLTIEFGTAFNYFCVHSMMLGPHVDML